MYTKPCLLPYVSPTFFESISTKVFLKLECIIINWKYQTVEYETANAGRASTEVFFSSFKICAHFVESPRLEAIEYHLDYDDISDQSIIMIRIFLDEGI